MPNQIAVGGFPVSFILLGTKDTKSRFLKNNEQIFVCFLTYFA